MIFFGVMLQLYPFPSSWIPPKATLQEKLWTKHEAWETILKEVMRPQQQPVALVQG